MTIAYIPGNLCLIRPEMDEHGLLGIYKEDQIESFDNKFFDRE